MKKSANNRRGKGKSHIRIRIDGKRVYLHRHVFETHVRPLEADEIVHHKDENKWNNSPENLEAVKGHAEHLRLHDYFRGRRKKLKSFDWMPEMPDTSSLTNEFSEFGF